MLKDLSTTGTVEIHASPSKVWEGLTNPAIIKKYLFGTNTSTDWKVGSPITFEGTYGENNEHSYKDKGTILEIVPLKLIQYSYWSGFSGLEDMQENYSTVTYTLEEKDGNTLFAWTQQGFASEERYEHSKEGMQTFVDSIRDVIQHP